jgi:GT2 family glycosyltransferase
VSVAGQASIVVPLLDQRAAWLAQCVHSALDQTVPTEVNVVFAPETPPERIAWLRDLARRHPRLHPIPEARPGFAAALNTGIAASTTPRVGLLMSDDWLLPSAVAECLPLSADIVSTGLTAYMGDGRTRLDAISRTPSQAEFERRSSLEHKASYLEHFFLFRRRALLAVGGADETIGLTGCDDYDLIWSMLERGATVTVLPRRLYNYRDHDQTRLTLRPREAQRSDLARILDKHGVVGAERARILSEHAVWFGEPVHVVARRRAMLRRLGADLETLVAARPAALVEAVPLSPLAAPSLARGAWRLRFADGTALKGRALQTEAQADTVARLVASLEPGSFARVLARHGRALLEEWIDGEPLDKAPGGGRHLRACGRMLARIHLGAPARVAAVVGPAERHRDGLAGLVQRGALERAVAERADALARRYAPRHASTGLCHGDFAAENLVIRPDGTLCLVDNETLHLGPHDYDLARAWYRWPMSPAQWGEFLSGYGLERDTGPFREHFPYWAVRALGDAAVYRLDGQMVEAAVPLERLQDLVGACP